MNPFLGSLLLLTALAAAPAPAAPAGEAVTPAAIRQAYDTVLPALVSVRIQVLEEREAFYEERTPFESIFDEFVRQRVPLRVIGTRVSADGAVLIRDPNLPLRRYGEIEGQDQGGQSVALRVAAILENHAAILLAPVKPPAEPLPFIAFAPAALNTGDSFLLAEPALLEDALAVSIEPYTAAGVAVEGHEKHLKLFWWQVNGSVSDMLSNAVPATAPVVLDARAQPIGIALDNGLWRTQEGADSWTGTDLMADRRISPSALEEMSKRILTQARSAVKEIEIQFRSDSRIAQQLGQEDGKFVVYGLHYDAAGHILVPTDMEREAIRQIDKFYVLSGEKRIEAQFEGLFRDFGAFVLRAKELTGEPAGWAEKSAFPRGKVFYTLSSRRRYGQRSDEVEYNRYLDVSTGYKETLSPVPRKPVRVGDLVTDADGRLIGFCAPFRREDKDEILARQSRRQSAMARQTRIYLFSDVGAVVKSPAGRFDVAARPMSKKEEQGLCWLGVEYQPLNPPLARALGAEGPTRGGARGLLVTTVYDASPAARQGIKVGDILLSIGVAGMTGELDLVSPDRRQDGRRNDGGPRLWHSCTNYLTVLLTQIGAGRDVRLTLLQGRKEAALAMKLEKAPDDFDSADSYVESLIGVTVKDLTYEVRNVLRLNAAAPGVVIADVVPGSKGAVAQIRPYEIITLINDQPVTSIKEFERLVRSAQARGRAEFLVTNLGMSRIVDLDLAAQ